MILRTYHFYLLAILSFSSFQILAQNDQMSNDPCNAGTWLFYREKGETFVLIAGHKDRDLKRGWATFGGMCDTVKSVVEKPYQAATRETHQESRAYYDAVDVEARVRYQKSFFYKGFHTFFLEVEKIEASDIENNNPPKGHPFNERGPYAWVKLKDLFDIVNDEKPFIDNETDKRTITIDNLPGILKPNSKMTLFHPFYEFLLNNQDSINSLLNGYDEPILKGRPSDRNSVTKVRSNTDSSLKITPTNLGVGKSTDRAFYHYLFDRSGSVIPNDPKQNILQLLNESWAIKETSTIWPIGFHSYLFGESKDISYYNSYNLFKKKGGLRGYKRDVVDSLNSAILDTTRVDQYTHVLTALTSLQKVGDFTSDGVFVFTDGQLHIGDVDGDYQRYLGDVKRSIRTIKKQRPFFIVQSSMRIENDFYDLKESDTIKVIPGKAAMGVDFFWINSNIDLKEHPEVISLYNEFLLYAHYQITNQDKYLEEDDVISKLLLLSKVFSVGADVESNRTFIKNILGIGYNWDSRPIYYASTEPSISYLLGDDPDLVKLKGYIVRDELAGDDLIKASKLLTTYLEDEKLYSGLIEDYQARSLQDNMISGYSQEIKSALITPQTTSITKVSKQNIDRDFEESVILGVTDYLKGRTKQEAMFVFYDQVYSKVMKPSSFIRDTLFYHFSKVIEPTNGNFDPNVLLLKEALNRDINLLPENLTKHPHAKNSEALQALTYTYHLVKELNETKNIENAFVKLLETTSNKGATTSIEKGLLFASQLIGFLNEHDLSNILNELTEEELDNISRLVTIWFVSQNSDITKVENLGQLKEKVVSIYSKYGQLKKNVNSLTKELESLTGSDQDITDLNEYKLELMLSVFRQSTDIMFAGLDLLEHIPDVNDFSTIKKQVYEYKLIANTAADVWLELHRKNYSKAASLIIPLLPDEVPVNLASDVLSKMKEYNKSVDKDIKAIIKQKVLIDKGLINAHLNHLKSSTELGKLLFEATKLRGKQLDQFLSSRNISFIGHLIPKIVVHKYLSGLSGDDLESARAARDKLEIWLPLILQIGDDEAREKKIKEIQQDYLTIATIQPLLDSTAYTNYATQLVIAFQAFADIQFVKHGTSRNISAIASKVSDTLEGLDPMYQDLLIQYFDFTFLNDDLKRLIAIAGEVSNASNAEDVKNIMESYALPVASYRLKRKESFTFMVNAYTGLGASHFFEETDKGGDLEFILSAPIGLETSFRTLKPFKSVSIFFPIIDVGNILNYRANNLDEENSDSDRDIRLENVFSPGVHLVFGLSKKHPFTLNLGYQTNPDRAVATLNFDLPLFRIK